VHVGAREHILRSRIEGAQQLKRKTAAACRRGVVPKAETGSYTQEDPIGFAGGVNLYAYAGSNPVSYSDPYGLCPQGLSALAGFLCSAIEATTTAIGSLGGFAIGGGGGALLTIATGGVNLPAVPAEAYAGAAAGAAGGLAVGQRITNTLFMADAGRGRGDNRVPNSQVDRIARENNLNAPGQRQLHDRITGRGLTPEEIADEAADVATHKKWVNPPAQ
jgi:hypothetical protein